MSTDDDDRRHSLPAIEGQGDDAIWHALPLALAPARPSAALRERLLAATATPSLRFAPFIDRLARLFDVSSARASELLAGLVDPATWRELLAPGVALFHLQGGPAVATADVGLVRIDPGARFPFHHHLGEEKVLILQGECTDDGGRVSRAGDLVISPAGSSHSMIAGAAEPLLYAVVVDGIDIPGIGRSRP